MMSKILLIEDNFKNRYLISFLLEQAGYEVLQASNGQTGLTLGREHRPDLILLDIQLPDMDGFAILDQIREDKVLTGTKVVAVTSYAMPGDREKILSYGCVDYIEKPINTDTFISQVECNLKEKRLP